MKQFEEDFEEVEGSSEYDLRDIERSSIGRGYRALNQIESEMFSTKGDLKQLHFRRYVSQARVLLKVIRRYAKDEEIKEESRDMEDKLATELNNMIISSSHIPSFQFIENVRETVEDLRHEANLRLPRKTEGDPRQAWKE